MKFIDARCPNCGGQVKFIQGNTLAKCEMCGSELQVEAEIKHRVQRAFDLISQKKWLAAESILNETLLLDSKNGQLYLGLLLCDLELSDARLLVLAKCDYSSNPNYLRAVRFLDVASRTELETLCSINRDSLVVNSEIHRFEKTEQMKAFEELNLFEGKQGSPSNTIIGLLVNTNFAAAGCEKRIVKFIQNTSARLDKLMDLHAKLSQEEKDNLEFYDEAKVVQAFQIYKALKQIMIENEICDPFGFFWDEYDFEQIEGSGIFDGINRKLKVAIKEKPIEREDLSHASVMDLIERIDEFNSDFLAFMSKANLVRLETALEELSGRASTIPLTKRYLFATYDTVYQQTLRAYRTVLPCGPAGKKAAKEASNGLMSFCSLLSRSLNA